MAKRSGATRATSPPGYDFGHIDDVKDAVLEDCPGCGNDHGKAVKVITRIIEEIPEPPPINTPSATYTSTTPRA